MILWYAKSTVFSEDEKWCFARQGQSPYRDAGEQKKDWTKMETLRMSLERVSWSPGFRWVLESLSALVGKDWKLEGPRWSDACQGRETLQIMSVRVWSKGTPNAPWVGKQTCVATVQNSMDGPQKIKHRNTIRSSLDRRKFNQDLEELSALPRLW